MTKLFNQSIGRLSLTKTKSLIHASLIVGTLVALLSSAGQALGQTPGVPDAPFAILLKGIYQPVVLSSNLGLSKVNLSDGSYSKTKIYPVSGITGDTNVAIGNFYQGGNLCAYELPEGSFSARFSGCPGTTTPDGQGGSIFDGTCELTILEGTGIYKSFVGGHIHMVDILHTLADGRRDEYCFCYIRTLLGSAAPFAVLAGTTITSTGNTIVNGDLGAGPGTAVTGFPPGVINGALHAGDPAAAQAQADLTIAYDDAAGQTLNRVTLAGNIGGQTLAPGLYNSTSSLAISSGDLTLAAGGDTNAVFIFQMASTLTTTSGRQVILSGGAKPANIYWQVGSVIDC